MLKLASPPYDAVIVAVPAEAKLVSRFAVPPLNKPVPMDVPPFWKVTVPVGVPAPGVVTATVAVKVTLVPTVTGLVELPVTVVVVLALATEKLKVVDVLVLKFVSPL